MNCIKERLLKSLDRRREMKFIIEEIGRIWCEDNGLNIYDYKKYNKNYTKPINYINREIKKVEKELNKY